jgi:hypothetical protein
MEQVIAGYMRQVCENFDCLHEGQHNFNPRYSCKSQIIILSEHIRLPWWSSHGIRDKNRFTKAFDQVPHEHLLKKIADLVVDSMVVVRIRELLLGRSQRFRVGGQLSEEVRVTSGVPQGSVLSPIFFLAYVNDIWRNIESKIRVFADDWIIYRKIVNNYDVEELQTDLNRVGYWAVFEWNENKPEQK